MDIKIKELRKLPSRNWSEVKSYNSIVVINSGKKHDSGWALMYVIGLDSDENPIEIAAACDDITWQTKHLESMYDLRNDMFFPSGAIHYWCNNHVFEVGHALSSITITLKKLK